MGTQVSQAVCPKCGNQGLFISTEDWKPVTIHCPCRKCGWSVDLKQFWPKKEDPLTLIILSTLLELQQDTFRWCVPKATLLDELNKRYKMPRGDAERIIEQLRRNGTIYEPREGYFKKTFV